VTHACIIYQVEYDQALSSVYAEISNHLMTSQHLQLPLVFMVCCSVQ